MRLPRFTPVIHVKNRDQAERNIRLAADCGADGIWLISHGWMTDSELVELSVDVAAREELWVGVNALSMTVPECVAAIYDVATKRSFASVPDGIWVDSLGVLFGKPRTVAETARTSIDMLGRCLGKTPLLFAGASFKYQPTNMSPEEDAVEVARYADVVVTSGSGTGISADPAKVIGMKEALRATSDKPLAVASGLTPENASEYAAHTDVFMVATGISRTFDELDPARVLAMAEAIRS